jgi:hypothetical protein
LYALFGVAFGAALAVGLTTPQRWQVLAFLLVLGLLCGRYLLPVSASIVGGEVTFRWPLRRVTVTPSGLVTARVLTGGGRTAVGLRMRGGVRWGVVVERFEGSPELADALSVVVMAAPQIGDDDRRAVVAELRRRAARTG